MTDKEINRAPLRVDQARLAQIRAWDGGDGEVADQLAVEEAVALLERARVLIPSEKPTRGGPTEQHPDAPYCKPDQSCCDFCCGN